MTYPLVEVILELGYILFVFFIRSQTEQSYFLGASLGGGSLIFLLLLLLQLLEHLGAFAHEVASLFAPLALAFVLVLVFAATVLAIVAIIAVTARAQAAPHPGLQVAELLGGALALLSELVLPLGQLFLLFCHSRDGVDEQVHLLVELVVRHLD